MVLLSRPQMAFAEALASMTLSSGSTVMIASLTLLKMASRRVRCSASLFCASMRSVMSRLTVRNPIMAPSALRIRETESSTTLRWPSLRMIS